MRFPLRVKLWILLAAASALPLVGLSVALMPGLSGLFEERAVQLLRLRAEAVTRQIQGLVDRGREDVLILSRLPAVRARLSTPLTDEAGAQAEVEAALVVFSSNRPAYERVAVADALGHEVALVERQGGICLPAEPAKGTVADYLDVECRGLPDALVHVGAHGWPSRPTVRYCTGAYGEAPGRLGHAILELRGERLLATLDPELSGATVQLHDAAGQVLAERRADGKLTLGGQAPPAGPGADVGGRTQARFSVTANSVEVVVPVRSSPDRGRPGWWVRITVTADIAFSPGRRIVRAAAAVMALVLLLAVLLGSWAAGHAAAPLSELSRAARRLAMGDWSAQAFANTGDEIEELSHDFRAMAEQLHAKEARLLEQQHLLHRSERLALLGRFAAEVAHEVGNPLAAIKASLQAMQEEAAALSPDDPRLERLVREIDRLDRILRGLLNAARRRPPQTEACDVAAVARGVAGLMEAQAARTGVTLALDLPDELPRARADGEQLQQVLFNLLANALEATPAGGRVTLSARADAGSGGTVQLAVADTGRGIPEADRARLLEPFFTTRPGGAGLGLAVADQIIRENQGTLAVDSNVGRGSTFTVALPVTRKEQ